MTQHRFGLDPEDPRTRRVDALMVERFGDPDTLERERVTPGLHRCPGGCGRLVARHLFACRRCWFRLPLDLRRPITHTYRRDARGHAQAMTDAADWYARHPRRTTAP